MTITCNICGELITAYQLIQEAALQEVSEKIIKHIEHTHKYECKNLIETHMTLASVLVWYLVMSKYVAYNTIQEDFVHTHFKEWEQKIAKELGLLVPEETMKSSIIQ